MRGRPFAGTLRASVHMCKRIHVQARTSVYQQSDPYFSGIGGAVRWQPMKQKAGKKAGISRRALILRVKRKLAAKGQRLASDHRGRYRVIDLRENVIVDDNVDLGKLAASLDCVRPWEEVR
jgi:hypothetical protein